MKKNDEVKAEQPRETKPLVELQVWGCYDGNLAEFQVYGTKRSAPLSDGNTAELVFEIARMLETLSPAAKWDEECKQEEFRRYGATTLWEAKQLGYEQGLKEKGTSPKTKKACFRCGKRDKIQDYGGYLICDNCLEEVQPWRKTWPKLNEADK